MALRLRLDHPVRHYGGDPRRMTAEFMKLAWAPVEHVTARQEITERLLLDPSAA